MNFSAKLKIIMNIFNITNSKLAKHLNIDASLVSRWKNGNRKPKTQQYYRIISEYIVSHAKMDYQKMAICEAIGTKTDDLLDDIDLSSLLTSWLSNDVIEIGEFPSQEYTPTQNHKTEVDIYYGINGKRELVLKFLRTIILSKKCYELLLMSEENMDWLTGDQHFLSEWSALLVEVIRRGNTIKIIHTIQRNSDELLSVIEKWLQLHLSGKVVSFYYPKYKENSYARTMFIAPNLLAITSSSIFDKNTDTANYLFDDKQVIRSLVCDYKSYLNECKPLMNIITEKNFAEFKEIHNPFEKNGNIITYRNFFPTFTMPSSLFKKIVGRLEIDRISLSQIKSLYKKSTLELKKFLQFNSITIIIEQKMLEMLLSPSFVFQLSDYHSCTNVSYLHDELVLHIKHLIKILKNNPSFNIYIVDKALIGPTTAIIAKENEFIVATNLSNPQSHFSIVYNEKNISYSIYEYFLSQIDSIPSRQRAKNYTIRKLSEVLPLLKRNSE